MGSSAKYDIILRKGRDYKQIFKFVQEDGSPVNWTGWTVKSQVRLAKRRDSDLVVKFSASIPVPVNGEVILELTDTQTGVLSIESAYYDILHTSPIGFDVTYIEGSAYVKPTVTSKE